MVSLRYVATQLCTCTWIEMMTGSGIVLYMLYLGNYLLAGVTVAAFAPLIVFHFAMTKLPKSNVDWKPRNRMRPALKYSIWYVALKSQSPHAVFSGV